MSSRQVEDIHKTLLDKLINDSGLVCVRSAPESLESSSVSGELEEKNVLEEEEQLKEEIIEEDTKISIVEEIHEELPDIFPTASLRKVLPDSLRNIEEHNRIHVLPEEFKTDIDPALIPKIAITAQQKYIDILGELTGCMNYKKSLAEFWFLDTLANLLRRAQEEEMKRQSQAVLILWFCEWMKEVQNFDAADRQRLLKRFKEFRFSTDYQFNLVRAVYTFTPEYTLIDGPYQIQNPKKLFAQLKVKTKKEPKKEKPALKGKKKEVDTEEYLALLELRARVEREQEELEDKDREEWNRRNSILPLIYAADEEFFNKYWPPPPDPEPEPDPEPKGKGKGKVKK